MADQELIYRITRAVYENLGVNLEANKVERLVLDLYRIIAPQTGNEPREAAPLAAPSSSDRLVISVFGVDRPGIVAAVAQILAEAECSIIDINQTVVQGKFAMVLIADAARSRYSVQQLRDRFRQEGERLGVRIYAQREDIFNAMHRV
ncbi:MAG: ACT domain-containing protein [Pyrinomonas sp.]|uniref:ACT domain-containing protein n=1 Tax=Pyrinomonas sp. TaxID=2080306 RepID=UPI003332D08B